MSAGTVSQYRSVHTKNILVLYYTRGVWPLRDTISTHLYCWRKYGRHRAYYVNVAFGYPERLLRGISVDVVILHTIYLSMRWSPQIFEQYTAMCRSVAEMRCTKIAIPQDEFIHTDMLDTYLDTVGVDHVLTCADPDQWPTIYPRMTAKGASFRTVLTGYLDEDTVARVDKLMRNHPERTIDIGYRAWRAQYWLGEHGMLKVWIADALGKAAGRAALTTDISLRDEDVLNGDDWFRFLMRCRTTPGVEGGASICDANGEIKQKVEAYLEQHPNATFEETRAACFADRDGGFRLACLSPRHLEACLTRTCQVLVRGNYNGHLQADRHYIPLERDLSNIDEVVRKVSDRQLVEEVARCAYEEVVKNPAVSYRYFVRTVEDEVMGAGDGARSTSSPKRYGWIARTLLTVRDGFHWWFIRQEVLTMHRWKTRRRVGLRSAVYAIALKWVVPWV